MTNAAGDTLVYDGEPLDRLGVRPAGFGQRRHLRLEHDPLGLGQPDR